MDKSPGNPPEDHSSNPRLPDQNNTRAADRKDPQDPSIASRIQSSATGLLQNTFSGPGPRSDLTSTLSASLSDKSGPSHSTASGSTQLASESLRPGAQASRVREGIPSAASFRTTQLTTASDEGGIEEDILWQKFQNGQAVDDFVSDYAYDPTLSKGKGKGKEKEPGHLPHENPNEDEAHINPIWNVPSSNYSAQNAIVDTDGYAVTSLLSDPSFQPSTFTPSTSPPGELDVSFFPSAPSPPQTSSKPLFASPAQRPSPLALIPAIDTLLAAEDWMSLPGVSEWLDLDSSYQDTVWGYLKPYVEAARKEVKERRKAGDLEGVGEGPAVRRLGLVLGHLRKGAAKL